MGRILQQPHLRLDWTVAGPGRVLLYSQVRYGPTLVSTGAHRGREMLGMLHGCCSRKINFMVPMRERKFPQLVIPLDSRRPRIQKPTFACPSIPMQGSSPLVRSYQPSNNIAQLVVTRLKLLGRQRSNRRTKASRGEGLDYPDGNISSARRDWINHHRASTFRQTPQCCHNISLTTGSKLPRLQLTIKLPSS